MTREITALNRELLDPHKTITWNVYIQYGVDLDQQLLPGMLWNVRAFYAPQEVIDELEKWCIDNHKSLSKAHGYPNLSKEEFTRELGWIMLDSFPSTNKEMASQEEVNTYVDGPAAPAGS